MTGRGGPPHPDICKENTAISKSFQIRRNVTLAAFSFAPSASFKIYFKGTISVHVC